MITCRTELFQEGAELSSRVNRGQSFVFVMRRCWRLAYITSVTRLNSQSVAPDADIQGRLRAILMLAHRLNRLRWSLHA